MFFSANVRLIFLDTKLSGDYFCFRSVFKVLATLADRKEVVAYFVQQPRNASVTYFETVQKAENPLSLTKVNSWVRFVRFPSFGGFPEPCYRVSR